MAATETIAAVATPKGKSALAVLRISGTDAFEISVRCIKEKCLFKKTPSRLIRLYLFKDPASERLIDQITAIKYPSPQSFTGEDMVEIICHGGPLIVQEILEALLYAGARSASRGEFTRRALLNGKIDILKAEAIQGIIESDSEINLLCAKKLYGGGKHPLEQWRKELIEQLARIENEIEFEEDISTIDTGIEGKTKIENFINQIKYDIEKRKKNRLIAEKGKKVVIAGPVNAGKSTLFNMLVGYNRVIVHSEPGTTRDIISEKIRMHGHDIQLFDTAGIRETAHGIEREGIERSREAIEGAGIIIWVTDAAEPLGEEELQELIANKDKNLLCVMNKIDKNNGEEKLTKLEKTSIKPIAVSLKNKINIEKLFFSIGEKIEEINKQIEIPDLLLNERHEAIGKLLEKELLKAKEEWGRPEIAAHHIKRGLTHLEELFGHTNTEEIMNMIFEKFCIGK